MADVTITHDEAVVLYNHLDFYILKEIQEDGEDYDNMNYLTSLIHVYEKCKKEAEKDNE